MSLASTGLLLALAQPQAEPPPPTPLIVDEGRPDRAVAAPAPARPPRAVPAAAAKVDAAEPAEIIRGIGFGGLAVPAVVAQAGRPFLGRAASRATLEALGQALSDAYAHSDVALYTVAIPAQTMRDGRLTVEVAEGFVERIDLPEAAGPLLRAYAARMQAERPLTRRSYERYVSLMRDVAGATLDIQLLRGARPGGVVLQIRAKRDRSDFALGFDNRGTSLLGDGQLRGEAHGYSLLRDGDRTDLLGLVGSHPGRLRYVSITHGTPLGSDGLAVSLSAGRLETRQKDSPVRGEATTASLYLAYPLLRGTARNLSLTAGVDTLDSDAAAFGTLLSSDRTRAFRAAASGSDQTRRRALTASVTISRGLDILGARGTPGLTDVTFTKVNGRVTLDRQFGRALTVRLRAAGQYSRDRLAPAERFAVGGADFGRAFDQAVLTGDRGYAGLAEIGWRPIAKGRLAASELYGFVDGADVRIEPRGPYLGARFDLASAGLGTRIAVGRQAWVELEGARGIDDPYPGYGGGWRFNIAWRLSLGKR